MSVFFDNLFLLIIIIYYAAFPAFVKYRQQQSCDFFQKCYKKDVTVEISSIGYLLFPLWVTPPRGFFYAGILYKYISNMYDLSRMGLITY